MSHRKNFTPTWLSGRQNSLKNVKNRIVTHFSVILQNFMLQSGTALQIANAGVPSKQNHAPTWLSARQISLKKWKNQILPRFFIKYTFLTLSN